MASTLTTYQLGNSLEINFPPKRIVSLVPSQTELLFDLGLYDEIAGITKFCIYPEDKVKHKPKIGGTKRFNIDLIKGLQPDLIIGNKEENYQQGIETLQKNFPVWMSDIYTLQDTFAMMREVSRITNRQQQGEDLVTSITNSFNSFIESNKNGPAKSVAYFIWRKPYMVAAAHTFITHILEIFGLENVYAGRQRYPEIEPSSLAELKPDFIFLSSEPYSFSQKHLEEFQSFSPASKVLLVDGEMFSWYGSRLKLGPAYFTSLKEVMNRMSS